MGILQEQDCVDVRSPEQLYFLRNASEHVACCLTVLRASALPVENLFLTTQDIFGCQKCDTTFVFIACDSRE